MDFENFLGVVRKRKARKGITTAYGYMRDLEGCLSGGACPWSLVAGTDENQWKQAVKDSTNRLCYQNDEMLVRPESFTKDYKLDIKDQIPPRGLCMMDVITTTTRKDRDGDVLETAGASVDPLGPVLWQHMPFHPIGKLVRVLRKESDKLFERIALIDNVMGRDAAELAEFGALRISHGFIPMEWEPLDRKSPESGFRVKQFEIMERSLVSVPSNPDAVILAFSREKLHSPLIKSWAKGLFDSRPAMVPGGIKSECGCGGKQGKCSCENPAKATEPEESEDDVCPECGGEMIDGLCQECGFEKSVKTPAEECPHCGGEMLDGKCQDCGYEIKDAKSEYDAPNYREAVDLGKTCATCALQKNLRCSAHRFVIQRDYVCDDHSSASSQARPPRVASLFSGWTKSGKIITKDAGEYAGDPQEFDFASLEIVPSRLMYDWARKHLGVPVKRIYKTSHFIPNVQRGNFLSAWNSEMKKFKHVDTRNMAGDAECPPEYKRIDLNSTKSEKFVVDAVCFYKSGPCDLIVEFDQGYYGIEMTVYSRFDDAGEVVKVFDNCRSWIEKNNFLKGEAFALTGEFIENTGEKWDDVFLEDENKSALRRAVDVLNAKGKSCPSRGVMMAGPPGTGKTLSGRIIRNTANATFIWIAAKDFYQLGAFGGIATAFELAKELAPSVLFFEDVDGWIDGQSVDLLKTEMDGIGRNAGVLTIMTTNFPERMPKALIDRPGRFHDVLRVALPDEKARTAMLRKWSPDLDEVTINGIVKQTEGYSGAHIYELAYFAGVLVETESIDISDAMLKAIDKVESQRELITQVQAGGNGLRFGRRMTDDQRTMVKAQAMAFYKGKVSVDEHRTEVNVKSGRVLSKSNEDKLRDILSDAQELLGMDIGRPAKALVRSIVSGIDGILASVSTSEMPEKGVDVVSQLVAEYATTGDATEMRSIKNRLATVLAGIEKREATLQEEALLRELDLVG